MTGQRGAVREHTGMIMTKGRLGALATILSCAVAAPAFAADELTVTAEEVAESWPYIEGTLDLSLGNDYVFSSGDPGAEINDLFFEGALAVRFGLFEGLAINAGVTVEPVLDADPFEDRVFGDHGLYLDTLNVEGSIGAFTITAGKFGPGFGTAWDVTPGIYGTGFAEDYEIAEQIGFGVAYAIETASMGTHTIGANVFFADNTVFSDSLFTSRGRTRVADGGIGNTGRLNNFSVTLDGSDFPSVPGLAYHVGYRHLSAGIGDMADENGFVIGLVKETELANGMVLGLNGEVAYFDNFGGTFDNALYATAGVSLASGPWHGELAGTIRSIDLAGAGSMTDQLVQVSGGYTFENGVDLALGYGFSRVEDIKAHVVGVRLSKSFEFSTRN